MTELSITTKPGKKYASIKNPRVYEALRKQGMSKQRAARISNAQMHKDAGTTAGAMAHGPGGLLATPGLGSVRPRKWGNRKKLKGCTCGVNVATKEQIAPGITRIRGNLCNVHGRYGPCDAGLSKKPRGRKAGAGRKPRKIPLTPEQRLAARQAQHEANRKKTLSSLGIAPDGQEALDTLRKGGQPDPAAIARGGFEKAGLVERAADGSYRMTASGRAMMAAADVGDAGRAGDTISSARDRTGAREQRQAASAERKRAAAERRKQIEARRAKIAQQRAKKQGAGGGKQSAASTPRAVPVAAPKPAAQPKPRPAPRQTVQRQPVAPKEPAQKPAKRAARVDTSRPGIVRGRRERKVTLARLSKPKGKAVALKAQTAEERAMFAKMGAGSSGGGGSKLWAKGPSGKRTPQAGVEHTGGTAKGAEISPKHSPELAQALAQTERPISIQPFETAYAFDTNGNRLFKIEGAQHEIAFTPAQTAQLKGAVLTHNHPHNVSFSRADIRTTIDQQLGEMRAVTGDHRYSLSVPPGTKWTPTLDAHITSLYQKRLDEARADVLAGKRTINDVNRNLHHELWSEIAKDQGWAYSREEW